MAKSPFAADSPISQNRESANKKDSAFPHPPSPIPLGRPTWDSAEPDNDPDRPIHDEQLSNGDRSPMRAAMTVYFHEEDLPAGLFAPGAAVAVDTETMGLRPGRDRLCLVQISDGNGDEHLVRFGPQSGYNAPNLKAVLADPARIKIFHFARFDLAAIDHYLGVMAAPVYCTKIASRLVRTYTDRHGLKELVRELCGQEVSKQQQSSDWGGPDLSDAQLDYAASDVRYLHRMRDELDRRLAREGRAQIAAACFQFLPTRARLDLLGWEEADIFAHA